jgi:hypothetical protein
LEVNRASEARALHDCLSVSGSCDPSRLSETDRRLVGQKSTSTPASAPN